MASNREFAGTMKTIFFFKWEIQGLLWDCINMVAVEMPIEQEAGVIHALLGENKTAELSWLLWLGG